MPAADFKENALTTTQRVAAIGLALGLGLGAMSAGPALAHTGGSDNHGPAWGLNVAGEDGPAFGLGVTHHGPAWGTRVHGRRFHLPIVLDHAGPTAWANGVSAFGIDGATITGDNPVADAYLGQSGGSNSTHGWRNDRGGWLGGLLADNSWQVGSRF